MSKVAQYLQEHISGEIISATGARDYLSTDNSILQVSPLLVVYPRNENDVRKAARFSWQLAERGRHIPITARGYGSDKTGAAIGKGMLMIFPTYMCNILELDPKKGGVIVEPGINFQNLNQTLETHSRFIPYPIDSANRSIGGAISNNSSGDYSFKYGPVGDYVKALRVVLSNGEVIETRRLSKRELSKKLGLSSFEGEIYRFIDTLFEEQFELIKSTDRHVVKNNAGYNILDVKRKDGTFDLTPLIIGSQCTLGIITEVDLRSLNIEHKNEIILAAFDSIEYLQSALIELNKLSEPPNYIELIDQHALKQLHDINPNHLKEIIKTPYPNFVLLIEFSHQGKGIKKSIKKTYNLLDQFAQYVESSNKREDQLRYLRLRSAISVLITHNDGLIYPLPLFDGAVPIERIREFFEKLYKILHQNNIQPALWGHAGDGNIFVQPKLNIGHIGDRQKAFRILDEYMDLVLSLDGTISSSEGDGRLKTPYLEKMYGHDYYNLMQKLKKVMDPYNILNPGIKFGTNIDDLKSIVRSEYTLKHATDYFPKA